MSAEIWHKSTGEWRTVPGVTSVSFGPLFDAVTAVSTAASAAASGLEGLAEAFRQDDWPTVPLVTTPCAWGQAHEPGLSAIWPHQFGKRAAFTSEGELSETARALFKPFFAELQVRRDRTVHRLAHDLGLCPGTARHQFDMVQHILETAGIGDGYGRLTIPQPVRTPIPALARP